MILAVRFCFRVDYCPHVMSSGGLVYSLIWSRWLRFSFTELIFIRRTTSVSRRSNILRIKFKISTRVSLQQHFSIINEDQHFTQVEKYVYEDIIILKKKGVGWVWCMALGLNPPLIFY